MSPAFKSQRSIMLSWVCSWVCSRFFCMVAVIYNTEPDALGLWIAGQCLQPVRAAHAGSSHICMDTECWKENQRMTRQSLWPEVHPHDHHFPSEGRSENASSTERQHPPLKVLTKGKCVCLETRNRPEWFNLIFTETFQGSLTGFYFKSQEIP